MTPALSIEEVAPGIFRCPDFLSSEECTATLATIYSHASWEKAALGKYVDNEVATSMVNLTLRDVEVTNGESIPLDHLRRKEVGLNAFFSERGFRVEQFSRYMVSRYRPGCHIRSHRDTNVYNTIRLFTVVLYLDEDFEGGQLFFPRLNYMHQPAAGELMFFFSEHEHGVSPVTSGTRHCIVWFAENHAIRERLW